MAAKFPTLQKISADLEKAEQAHALLKTIWAWYGPYGLALPEGVSQADVLKDPKLHLLIKTLDMPEELRLKIRDYFRFDDDE